MRSNAPILSLDSVSIQYGSLKIAAGVSFEVGEGEFVTLLGPSGSGKTSLLRAIAGFVKPTSGDISLRGLRINDMPPYERDIGMVFQNYALFPHMTVADNLRFGLRMSGLHKREIETRVHEALGYVRLGDFHARYPHELSGGQQQRVAIARAIAIQPTILLLDEPMSNLDARLRSEMRYELTELLSRLGITSVSVTHNQDEALSMSDRVVILADGRIRQVGSPVEIYNQPADPFVADFIGDANVMVCHRVEDRAGPAEIRTEWGHRILTADAWPVGARDATLLIRPELIEIAKGRDESTPNCLHGRVAQIAYMGALVEFQVDVSGRKFRVKKLAAQCRDSLSIGDSVVLSWDSASMVALKND